MSTKAPPAQGARRPLPLVRTLQNPKAELPNPLTPPADFHTSGGVLPGAHPTGEGRPTGGFAAPAPGPRTPSAPQGPGAGPLLRLQLCRSLQQITSRAVWGLVAYTKQWLKIN